MPYDDSRLEDAFQTFLSLFEAVQSELNKPPASSLAAYAEGARELTYPLLDAAMEVVDEAQSAFVDLFDRMELVEGDLADIRSRIVDLETRVDAIDVTFADYENRLTTLESDSHTHE